MRFFKTKEPIADIQPELFKRASDNGLVAQLEIAARYRQGDGVEKSTLLAESWLKKAAQQGSAKAAVELGNLYQYDKSDCATSMLWYQKAIDIDETSAEAAYHIGWLYLHCESFTQDKETARVWLTRAGRKNHRYALMELWDLTKDSSVKAFKHLDAKKITASDIDVETLSQLEHVELAKFKNSIIDSAQPSVSLSLNPNVYTKTWESKAGGMPYLPINAEFPHHSSGHPLTFLLQINFAEMPALPNFPSKGILQFFIDAQDEDWGFGMHNQHAQDGFRVVYYPEVLNDNQHLQSDYSAYRLDALYPAYSQSQKVEFSKSVSFIDLSDDFFGLRYDDDLVDRRTCSPEFRENYHLNKEKNIIGGYPRFSAFDFRTDVYIPQSMEELQSTQRLLDYRQLLRLEFDKHIPYVSFFIHPDDLRNERFDKVIFYFDGRD